MVSVFTGCAALTREQQLEYFADMFREGGITNEDAWRRAEGNLREAEERGAAEQQRKDTEIDKDRLADLIEGMEVSVDVSTCEEDAGHRLFGTVTVVKEDASAKNGLISLVQEPVPNFEPHQKDVNGQHPAKHQHLINAAHDVLAHESSWLKLLCSVPPDKEGYVSHEIAAFNRDMQRLRAALTQEGEE